MDIINGKYAKCREVFKKRDVDELRKQVDWQFKNNLHSHCIAEQSYKKQGEFFKSPTTTESFITCHGLTTSGEPQMYPYDVEIWNTFTVTMSQKVRRYLEKTNPKLLERQWEYKEPCISGYSVFPHSVYAMKWSSTERFRKHRKLSFSNHDYPLHWSGGYRLKPTKDIKYKNDKFINVIYYLDKGTKFITDSQRKDLNIFDGGTVVKPSKNFRTVENNKIFKDESENNSAFIFTDHEWSLAGEDLTAIVFTFSIFSENRHSSWMYPRVVDYENRMKRRCKNSIAVSQYILSETGKIHK